MNFQSFPYRHADAVLSHSDFEDAKAEIERAITETTLPLLTPDKMLTQGNSLGAVKRRKRPKLKNGKGERYFFLPVDQIQLNVNLKNSLITKDWQAQPEVVSSKYWESRSRRFSPLVTDRERPHLKADFFKNRIHVEAQFGNMARWYTDVFKFQVSYSLETIDVAVLIVPRRALANLIDENVATYERVIRELPLADASLTLPIMVYGLEPTTTDWIAIRETYDASFTKLQALLSPKEIEKIPLSETIETELEDEEF